MKMIVEILKLICTTRERNAWMCLTHYQTTNFRLFQTERVCRRQLWIWWKWQEVLWTVRKHCGKRRNCSLQAISPFSTVFSKDLYCRHVKTRAFLGKGLMVFDGSEVGQSRSEISMYILCNLILLYSVHKEFVVYRKKRVNPFTLSQMTNFRLFQIQKVCRWQF